MAPRANVYLRNADFSRSYIAADRYVYTECLVKIDSCTHKQNSAIHFRIYIYIRMRGSRTLYDILWRFV